MRERIIRWFRDGENLLFFILVVACLIPVWVFEYFPSQDGPCYLETANVIRHYNDQSSPIFRAYYEIRIKSLTTNSLAYLFIALLLFFVRVILAEKIFLSAYLILFPISIRYVLCAIDPKSKFLAVLSFLFLYNSSFNMGFYNFISSLPLVFFLIGCWIKYQTRFTIRSAIAIGFLSLLCNMAHPFSVLAAYLTIGILVISFTISDMVGQARNSQFNIGVIWKSFKIRTTVPLLVFLLTIAHTATPSFITGKVVPLKYLSFSDLWHYLIYPMSLLSHGTTEVFYSKCVFFFIAAIFIYILVTKTKINYWDGLFFIVIIYIVMYFTMPDQALFSITGGGYISMRINLYIFLMLIIWFGGQYYSNTTKKAVQFITIFFIIAMLSIHTNKYAEINYYLKEYISNMKFIKPNTTILPLNVYKINFAKEGDPLSFRVRLFRHTASYIAAQRDGITLCNHLSSAGGVKYHYWLDPYIYIGDMESSLEKVDILNYNSKTKGGVDYVLLWIGPKHRPLPPAELLFRQLKTGYDLIYISPNKYSALYRKKNYNTYSTAVEKWDGSIFFGRPAPSA